VLAVKGGGGSRGGCLGAERGVDSGGVAPSRVWSEGAAEGGV
jgi:hypothetical protein